MSQSSCAYLAGGFPSVSTVRVSAAGQPLGACTCNFAMGMRTSAGPYSTSCRWPQRQKKKRYKDWLQNGGWERETRRQSLLCKRVHDSFRVWHLQKVLCSQRSSGEGACRFARVHPLASTSRVHSRTVPPENALAACTRATEILIQQVQMLLT